MNNITLLVDDLNKGEEHSEYVLSSLKETCELVGLKVKSISVSGDTSYITREFIKLEDVIDVEFTEVIKEEIYEENIQLLPAA